MLDFDQNINITDITCVTLCYSINKYELVNV